MSNIHFLWDKNGALVFSSANSKKWLKSVFPDLEWERAHLNLFQEVSQNLKNQPKDAKLNFGGQSIAVERDGDKLFASVSLEEESEEKVFFPFQELLENLDVAILIEDNDRRLQYTNQAFCDYFSIPVSPKDLHGADCAEAAEASKELFLDPHYFIQHVESVLAKEVRRGPVSFEMADQRMLEQTYIPLLKGEKKVGHLWLYRDTTMQYLSGIARKASEDKYRKIIENINLGLMEVDREEKIRWANEPFLQKTGYKLKELIGKDAREVFLFEEDRAKGIEMELEKVNKNRMAGLSSAFEVRMRTKGNQSLWMQVSGAPIQDSNGQISGSLGIHHDVTEAKENRLALAYRSEFQSILLALAEKLLVADESSIDAAIQSALEDIGRFVNADRAYIFDYDFEAQTTSNTYEWCEEGIEPEIENLQDIPIEALEDWVETHQRGDTMVVPDVLALPKNSTLREVLEPQGIQSLITVPLYKSGGALGFIGFDAVKIKKAWSQTEQELLGFLAQLLVNHRMLSDFQHQVQESEERMRKILASAMDAVITINEEGRIEQWNVQAERIFGYQYQDVLGKELGEIIIPPKYHRAHQEGMSHFLETGEGPILNKRIELVANRKSGESFPMEMSVIPIKHEGKHFFSAFLRDITDQKKAQDDMANALEQQRELATMKSRLISMASHEFRTPLTTIKANADLLEFWSARLEEENQQKASRYLNRIIQETDRLSNIMNDLLVLGRLESGRITVNKRNVDLLDFSRELIDRVYNPESNEGRTVEVKIEGAPRLVATDLKILEHILSNLLENAWKYSPKDSNPKIILNFLASKVRVSVIDQGIGIPVEEQDRIFSTFYRASNAKESKGSGMGLAIVKQMAEMHGMDIKFFSTPKEGTEFIIEW